MFFYETSVRKDETFLAGKTAPAIELHLRVDRLVITIVAVLILVGLALYAQSAGWSEFAKETLKIASSLVTGFFAGTGVGEKRAARSTISKVRSTMSGG